MLEVFKMIRTLHILTREQWISKVGHACLKHLIIVMQQDVIWALWRPYVILVILVQEGTLVLKPSYRTSWEPRIFIAVGKTPCAYGPCQEIKVTLKNPMGLRPTFAFDNGPLEAFTPRGFDSFVPIGVESLTRGITKGEVKY